MPRRGRDKLFLPGEFKFYGPSGLERSERQNILDEHFLLAAKPAADALAKYPDLVACEIENLHQRPPGQERRLRTGTNVENAGGVDPGETAMGFQRGVLDALGRECSLVGDRGLRKRICNIAVLTMGFRHDVAPHVADALF